MDQANKITNQILDEIESSVKEGITTQSLDDLAEDLIKKYQVISAFKGYRGFPKNVCISINEEIVHGLPSERIIKNGDLVSVDFGVLYKDFYGDAARTFIVGQISTEVKKLVEETKKALFAGIEQMRVGNRLWDICGAIEQVAKNNKYGIVRGMGGHGVNEVLHAEPFVPNYINKNIQNVRLRNGMVLAIEPMFILGKNENIKTLDDGWTVVSSVGALSAHWEYSVAIVNGSSKILGI